MARLRKRAAGKGIHFFVFIDDCLCVGDTEEYIDEGGDGDVGGRDGGPSCADSTK